MYFFLCIYIYIYISFFYFFIFFFTVSESRQNIYQVQIIINIFEQEFNSEEFTKLET